MIFLFERGMITCTIRHYNQTVLEMFFLTLFVKEKKIKIGLFTLILKIKKINEKEGINHVQEKEKKKNKNGWGNRGLATIQYCGAEGV